MAKYFQNYKYVRGILVLLKNKYMLKKILNELCKEYSHEIPKFVIR
jgi:hypothetical protein